MEVVLDELRSLPWASPLIARIDQRGGISVDTQPELFEARVAHELHRVGSIPEYEFMAGVGDTSVDFRIPGQPEFLVEVVSLRTSEGVQAAVRRRGHFVEHRLSTESLRTEGHQRQSIESELILVQQKLGEKVLERDHVVKFPSVESVRKHVLVMDVRSVMGGGEEMKYLRHDLLQVTYGHWGMDHVGGRRIRLGMQAPAADGSIQSLRGIFEDIEVHPLRAAPLLRERIHAVHFVCERMYTASEIPGPDASYLVPNRRLIQTEEEFARFKEQYPLA
jgi:hypothetical protein